MRNNRWMVLTSAIWLQSCAGLGYVFGSISPVLKKSLGYNQKQLNTLGVAKDLGDSIGFFAGFLSEILPSWAMVIVGASLNLLGYLWIWLLVIRQVPVLPFWIVCILIYVGTNGETFFNTTALVSCVQTFPNARGPIVGILKGFTGLSGAIFTQIYVTTYAPDQASFIFIVAVVPFIVALSVSPLLSPINPVRDARDKAKFNFIYTICLVLAAYLLVVMILQDTVTINSITNWSFTVILLVMLVLPVILPLVSQFLETHDSEVQESLLEEVIEQSNEGEDVMERMDSMRVVMDAESSKLIYETEKDKLMEKERVRWLKVATTDAVSFKRLMRKGPHRGEDFTLLQALKKADFWLLFFALVCGGGAGLTVIDNMGQISESQGYPNGHIFVSMISIWNFLGRIGGGYLSEIVARDCIYPRPLTIATAQLIIALGQVAMAGAWNWSMYAGTLMVGLGYGAHWSIVPATASELFGLRNFGALYNFITMANPVGSLFFSGVVAGSIYDWEAEKQSGGSSSSSPPKCFGRSCFFKTHLIMVGACLLGVVSSLILSYRTARVYRSIYGKGNSNKGKGQEILENA